MGIPYGERRIALPSIGKEAKKMAYRAFSEFLKAQQEWNATGERPAQLDRIERQLRDLTEWITNLDPDELLSDPSSPSSMTALQLQKSLIDIQRKHDLKMKEIDKIRDGSDGGGIVKVALSDGTEFETGASMRSAKPLKQLPTLRDTKAEDE